MIKLYSFSLKQAVYLGFGVLLILYTLFQGRFLILGPVITIDSPKNGEHITQSVIMVEGHAQNIAYISFNDRPIFIDAKGNWSEKYAAPPGLSIITLRARDRFGRETEKSLELVYN